MPEIMKKSLYIPHNDVIKYNAILESEIPINPVTDIIYTLRALFSTGVTMHLLIVNDLDRAQYPCFVRIRWICPTGNIVTRAPRSRLLGEYTFWYDGITYTVDICAEKTTQEPIVESTDTPAQNQDDDVNHPKHYCVNGLECIDVIEALELNYHFSNAFKYLWRAGRKSSPHKDIRKAVWYLNRWLDLNPPTE